jgi:hypothetical protein
MGNGEWGIGNWELGIENWLLKLPSSFFLLLYLLHQAEETPKMIEVAI